MRSWNLKTVIEKFHVEAWSLNFINTKHWCNKIRNQDIFQYDKRWARGLDKKKINLCICHKHKYISATLYSKRKPHIKLYPSITIIMLVKIKNRIILTASLQLKRRLTNAFHCMKASSDWPIYINQIYENSLVEPVTHYRNI